MESEKTDILLDFAGSFCMVILAIIALPLIILLGIVGLAIILNPLIWLIVIAIGILCKD